MKTMTLGIAAAALLGLAACDSKDDGTTAGQKLDQAIASAKSATEDAKENAQRGLDRAAEVTKEKSEQLAQKTEVLAEKAQAKADAMAERAGDKAEQAGQQAERATAGAAGRASDATITAAVKAGLAKDPEISALRIDVDTHDGKVSLTGTAPSAAAKQRASTIAQGADGVTAVDNRLTVAAR